MRLLSLLGALALIPSLGFAQSTPQTEILKITPINGSAGATFGEATAISGTRAIVGARLDSSTSFEAGSAYIFDTGSGIELAKLQSGDLASGDLFGTSVALQGTLALVGAPGDDDLGNESGSAYLFNATTGAQSVKLLSGNGGSSHQFGTTVALSGSTALVYSPVSSGRVDLFGTTLGLQTGSLSGTGEYREFGAAIAVDGDRVLVGAPGKIASSTGPGVAFLFDVPTRQLLLALSPNNGLADDRFGESVAISGGRALIGSPQTGNNGNDSGSAYIFDLSTGQQQAKLLPCEGASHDRFGSAVAISGNLAIIGAELNHNPDADSGSVHYFDIITGRERANLRPTDAAPDDYFGSSVAGSATSVLVGAYGDDDNGSLSGSAYLFDAAAVDNSGSSFCFGDGTGVACPCGANGNSGEGCANTTGIRGASLRGIGNAAITADTFGIAVVGVPGNKPGLILRGSNQHVGGLGAPVGDGLLCTSANTARSHVQVTNNGNTTFSNFQGAPFGAWANGPCISTYYQFWYRDPSNTCSGSGFNFTNAWAVYWLP